MAEFSLNDLERIVVARGRSGASDSWTARLFEKGIDKAAQKLGEEAVEAAIAAVKGDRAGLVGESADLLYHLVVVLAIIQGFQIFDQVFIMTARTVPGGVGGSATTLTYFLYDAGFVRSQFGYASSVAVVLFMIILSVTVVQLRLQRYWVYYESGEAR